MPQSAASLARLERALARLDAASTQRPSTADSSALEDELTRLRRQHAALKDTATRVANRLDGTIAKLAKSVAGQSGGQG